MKNGPPCRSVDWQGGFLNGSLLDENVWLQISNAVILIGAHGLIGLFHEYGHENRGWNRLESRYAVFG